MKYGLGFLGAGNMAEAIATAAIRCKILRSDQMIASDPSDQRREVFARMGIPTVVENQQVIRESGQLLLAIKPQIMPQVAVELGRLMGSEQILVSIMAGVTTTKLAAAIKAGNATMEPRIVRVMPNTPLQVGLGMSGVALGEHARAGDDQLAMEVFGASGKAVRVDESALDAITAVSGSGPAYVFYLAEAMEKAASELGLGQHARLLVQQTILGAAQLMVASTDSPADLRRKVTSPGGTTEAAIRHMDAQRAADTIVEAIKAAERRSKELGA
jgi:pyrroline-5-carboxylate reductase